MKADIDILLDKYFAGETTSDEEKQIRRHFAENELSDEMQEIAPIFAYMEDEAAALAVLDEVRRETETPVKPKRLLKVMFAIAAVAASLFIGIVLVNQIETKNNRLSDNCVWVNGKKLTDPEIVMQYARKSLGEVKPDTDILEEQLSFMME